jgi:hypothetical protein
MNFHEYGQALFMFYLHPESKRATFAGRSFIHELNIQIPHALGMGLNELLARVHGVTHEHIEGAVGLVKFSACTAVSFNRT